MVYSFLQIVMEARMENFWWDFSVGVHVCVFTYVLGNQMLTSFATYSNQIGQQQASYTQKLKDASSKAKTPFKVWMQTIKIVAFTY